jgi:hypothetical protein
MYNNAFIWLPGVYYLAYFYMYVFFLNCFCWPEALLFCMYLCTVSHISICILYVHIQYICTIMRIYGSGEEDTTLQRTLIHISVKKSQHIVFTELYTKKRFKGESGLRPETRRWPQPSRTSYHIVLFKKTACCLILWEFLYLLVPCLTTPPPPPNNCFKPHTS